MRELAGRERLHRTRVGVIGFCLGGGLRRAERAQAPVRRLRRQLRAGCPRNAAAVLRGSCPIVASYGRKDLPLRNAAAKLEAALTTAGVEHDVKEYPGASHSFLSRHHFGPFGPLVRVAGVGYHGPSAEDALGSASCASSTATPSAPERGPPSAGGGEDAGAAAAARG